MTEPHSDEEDRGEEMVQCYGCKEWWHEDDSECPSTSDWCVDNTHDYCTDCRHEVNND
jgi:hypothetical protein